MDIEKLVVREPEFFTKEKVREKLDTSEMFYCFLLFVLWKIHLKRFINNFWILFFFMCYNMCGWMDSTGWLKSIEQSTCFFCFFFWSKFYGLSRDILFICSLCDYVQHLAIAQQAAKIKKASKIASRLRVPLRTVQKIIRKRINWRRCLES